MEYNNAMNGVDKLDQNIRYYPFVRKSQKWTKKFVTYLFQISLFNAFVIYKAKNQQGNCKTLLSFIHSVIKSWTSQELAGGGEERVDPPTESTPRAPYNTDPRNRVNDLFAVHALVLIASTSKKQHPTRRFRVCARNRPHFTAKVVVSPYIPGIVTQFTTQRKNTVPKFYLPIYYFIYLQCLFIFEGFIYKRI